MPCIYNTTISPSATCVGPPVLNNVTPQVIQWGGTRTIECPYQPDGSYRDGISVRWRLLRGNTAIIQHIMNSIVYSVDSMTYSLTIKNFTPVLQGDYECILTYDIDDVYDSIVNGDYSGPVVPASGSAGTIYGYYILLPSPAWAEGTVLSLCVCVCLCVTTKLL